MMVAQHHHIVAVDLVALAFRRLDDDGCVHAPLLLAAGVAVVPVGAGLPDLEAVGEGGARLDAGEAHHRHTVHVEGHENAVPVDRRVFREPVGDVDDDVLALLPVQGRPGDLTVDGKDLSFRAIDADGSAIDDEIVGAGEGRRRTQQDEREHATQKCGHGGLRSSG